MGRYFISEAAFKEKKKLRLIEAPSASEALQQAREEGFLEPVLETDDVSALFQQDASQELSEHELFQFRRMGKWQAHFFVLKKLLLKFSIFWGTGLVIIIVNRFREAPWSRIDVWGVGLFIVPIVVSIAVCFWPSRTSITIQRFEDMLTSFVRTDWYRVIELVEDLEDSEIPSIELAFRKASALAALGNLDHALEVLQPWINGDRTDDAWPEWMVKVRLAEVYSYGGLPEKGIATTEDAAKLAPGSPIMQLDLAKTRISQGDVSGAVQAMKDLKHLPVTSEIEPMRDYVEASISNEQRDPVEALNLILPAREKLKSFLKVTPIWALLLAAIDYEIAIAYSLSGDASQAEAYYQRSAPLLQAHRRVKSLERGERLTRDTVFPFASMK